MCSLSHAPGLTQVDTGGFDAARPCTPRPTGRHCSAGAHSDTRGARRRGERDDGGERYYLALGDSIAYGIQPTNARPDARPSDFDTGYVDVLAARLRKLSPGLQVVTDGCPGESTLTFSRGGCPAFGDRVKLHDAFRGSQLAAALAFLRAHPGEVSPITLTLFGNDWLPLVLDTCKGSPASGSAAPSQSQRSARGWRRSSDSFERPRRPPRSS